jgi:hypothetical protein
MAGNLLTFEGSQEFRNKLLSKNLPSYKIEGVYSSSNGAKAYPYSQSDIVPNDTPNVSQSIFDEATEAIVSNKYGPSGNILDSGEIVSAGGGGQVSMSQAGTGDVNDKNSEITKPYDESSANLQLLNNFYIDAAAVVNRYSPPGGYNGTFISTENIQPKTTTRSGEYPNFLFPDFVFLNPLQGGAISLNDISSNALSNFSQDSYLQQLSTIFLADAFRERVNREIEKNTIGRVNLQAFSDVFSASLLASGQQGLVAKNWTITVPDGVFDQAKFLLQRFSGTYIPTSPIEGEYFQTPQRQKTKAGQLVQSVINKFTKPATPPTGSKKFLNNTGSGQKSVLFDNLGYNRFKPDYEQNTTQIGIVVDNLFNRNNSLTNFYVGTETNDPLRITSPSDQVPYDAYGNQTSSIVLGPDGLAKEYEGTELERYKFGLASVAYNEDQDPSGGFSWVDSRNKSDAGKYVGPGGENFGIAPVFQGNVGNKFASSESTNVQFKKGSILDETQRLIESAPVSGAKRLVHVGNAINQVSKVFNDGYKELTKGSKVRKFVNKNGVEVGQEYGRVFTKDIPYLTYQNLQSTIANSDGLETNGNIRKFTYSVLDSTYNLNIAPVGGDSSTNIKDGRVKKYMFSIENLAWRNTPEFEALPDCEKGPNGGRIMWFPPYDLKLDSETSTPKFNQTNFLGRPEPIYTYDNTTRTGGISWSIIVDHPSISNLIVKKELERADGNLATQVMASFFAGCKKYDIYELARKYTTLGRDTIEEVYQKVLESNQTSDEQKKAAIDGLPSSNIPESNEDVGGLDEYVNFGFYFPEYSSGDGTKNYTVLYDQYVSQQSLYLEQNTDDTQISSFFQYVLSQNTAKMLDLKSNIGQILENDKGIVEITLNGTQILGGGNISVSNDWFESAKLYFTKTNLSNNKTIKDYENSGKIVFKKNNLGTLTTSQIQLDGPSPDSVDCTTAQGTIYSFFAAACRAVKIEKIIVTPPPVNETSGGGPVSNQDVPNQSVLNGQKPKQNINLDVQLKGLSKKIIRELLTECNYFEVLKSTDSFIYDTIKNKFKFFNPAFHSITPEGLNARLVFLNQCVRPGRTIPTKQENGDNIIKDSFNTNFGTPPVLVLRFGDFYNTKIIPQSLSISYEPLLDLNPEGIGVQPMIAKISLGFDMIGGHGLKAPVEKLQNALSFNYYANTEMYDERADATEDTTAVDKALLEALYNEEPIATVNDVNNTTVNDGGTTFGLITQVTPLENGIQSGSTQYKEFFNGFIDVSQEYFNNLFTNYENFVNEYGLGIWAQSNITKDYYDGYIDNLKTPNNRLLQIYGKPKDWQASTQELGQTLKDSINDEDDELSYNIKNSNQISNNTKNIMIDNYLALVDQQINSGFISIATYVQNMSDLQLKMTKYMSKMDCVSFSGDGKILNDGNTKLYNLSGNTVNGNNSLTEFFDDYLEVCSGETTSIGTFEVDFRNIIFYQPNYLIDTPQLSKPFYKGYFVLGYDYDNLNYMMFQNILLNNSKKEKFITDITKNITKEVDKPFATAIVTAKVNGWIEAFKKQKDFEKEFLSTQREEFNFGGYPNFNPQINGISLRDKDRPMSFVTGPNSTLDSAIKDIYSSVNSGPANKFNGKKQFN